MITLSMATSTHSALDVLANTAAIDCRRNWGFVICGSDLAEAVASFDEQLKEALVLSAEAGDTMADGSEQPRLSDGASGHGSTDGKPLTAVLSHAFKRLQERVGLVRTQSEPAPELCGAVKSPKGGDASGKLPFAGMSEPSSPMIGAELLPDSMRTISTAARRQSSEFRVPSIQAGLRPW